MLCLQELFYGPYFCAEQETRWYHLTERVPDGPTVRLMRELAKKHGMVLVVPIYEEEQPGVYYNTAAVIDADGKLPRQVPQDPHPALQARLLGEVLLPAGQSRLSGVRHGVRQDRRLHLLRPPLSRRARALGLNGAEIVFNPSATVAGLSEYLWKLEQPAHAVANGYFVGAINRVGRRSAWNIGEFYGTSYFCDPRGQIHRGGAPRQGRVVVADLDLDLIEEVRSVWQFYRDRRPEAYGALVAP